MSTWPRAWYAPIPSSGTRASRRFSPGESCGSTVSSWRRALCPRCRARKRVPPCWKASVSSASSRCPGAARRATCRRASPSCDAWAVTSSGGQTLSMTALAASIGDWLAPWLDGITRREHLARIPLLDALRARLSWDQRRELDALAPTHLPCRAARAYTSITRTRARPRYPSACRRSSASTTTPRIGGGRVPVTFKLLSPAQRPVQVTRDLASFWRGSYAEVRKDMRGRYPKHYWPENPLEAEPVRGVRRRT